MAVVMNSGDSALRRTRLLGSLVLSLLGSVLTTAGCGGDDKSSGQSGSGDTIGCLFDIGLFSYCSEYRGFSKSDCEQSHGVFYAQCPANYVGICEIDANVNPKKTYFYGTQVTAEAAKSVCPGGKYMLSSGSTPSGSAGAGGAGPNAAHAGAGGDSGSSSQDCNDLPAPTHVVISGVEALEDAPTLRGGTISSGTYQLTAHTLYGAPPSQPTGLQREGLLVVNAGAAGRGTMQSADASGDSANGYGHYTFSYVATGSSFVLNTTCGNEVPTLPGTYAATSTTFEMLLDTPLGDGTTFKVDWYYEKK